MTVSKRPSKAAIRASFSNAAKSYEAHAVVQREVADATMALVEWVMGEMGHPFPMNSLLEIGCGTGLLTRRLASFLSPRLYVALDISHAMAWEARDTFQDRSDKATDRQSRPLFLAADGEALPFSQEAKFDLIVSASTLQWFNHLESALEEIERLLSPKGTFCATIFTSSCVPELKWAISKATGRDVILATDTFPSLHEISIIAKGLSKSSGRRVFVDSSRLSCRYHDLKALLKAFKKTGTAPFGDGSIRGTGRRRPYIRTPSMLKAVERLYMDRFGEITASYEVASLVLAPRSRGQDAIP